MIAWGYGPIILGAGAHAESLKLARACRANCPLYDGLRFFPRNFWEVIEYWLPENQVSYNNYGINRLRPQDQSDFGQRMTRQSLLRQKKQYEEEYDPKKKPELEAQLKSVLESIVNGDPSDRESTLTLAEMYLNNSKNVISTASLTRAGELATVFVSSSKYKDDRAVHILYESQRRLQKTSDAKQTLKRGLAATPASELLTADARQETIEQQLQGTAPESR